MVPEGWARRRLDQVADIRTGVAKGKTGLKNPVSLPYLRVANVQDGYLDLSEMKEIEVESTQVDRYSLRDGDIVLTEGGDFDKLGRGTIWRSQVPYCLHQNHIFAVRITSPNLLPEFFAMQAGSKYGRDYFLSCAKRSTNLASINSSQLKQFPVLLPPLPEQQKIAEILSTWDKAIETTEALLANARTQKRALMQSLLTGTRRFPGFEGQPWQEVRLGDLGTCIRGVSYKPEQTLPQETVHSVRLYRSTNIQLGEIVEADLVFVPPELVTDERILRTGDLAVCMSNGSKHLVGKSAPFRRTDSKHTVGAFCAIFRPRDIHEADFVRSLFQSPKFDDQITTSLAGSSINNLKNSDIEGMRFSIPSSKDERLLVTQVLMTIETEVNRVHDMLEHLRTEKRSLMQQLLTGKRRVSV